MKFDSNNAWNRAIASVGANRDVLLPVAGVFFLLPALASTWLMSDAYELILANLRNPNGLNEAMQQVGGKVYGFGLLSFVIQMIGYMAMLALLTDRTRPTVGQAIGSAVRSLPTLVAATLIFAVGYAFFVVALSMVVGLLAALTKSAAVAVVLGIALLVAVFAVMVRLSLTLPVIVIEGVMSPVAALVRSWNLTRGNGLRIFTFYLLLMIGLLVLYLVFAMVFGLFIGFGSMAAGSLSQSTVPAIAMGLVGAVVGTLLSVVMTGVLAAIHAQLAGPSTEAISDTFA